MIQENALQSARAEWVKEDTVGEAPTDSPDYKRFSDYLADVPGWDGSPDINEGEAVGSGDIVNITRGSEEHSFTMQYWLQRAPVDGSGNIQDPIAVPFTHDFSCEIDSHTVVYRREVDCEGADGNGFRAYTVGLGCKPVSATIPGDPGESSPQSLELEYSAEYGRSHVIHQPSASTELVVTNDGTTGVDVTIENEGASTTETVTAPAGGSVTTTATFADIDAIYVEGSHDGDIMVGTDDGTGSIETELLESAIAGTDTNGVDYEIGVPALGSGSRGSAISTDPERFLGLNASVQRGGSTLSERVHGFDLTAELDSSSEAVVGSRFSPVDEGTRTVSADIDVAGPFESTKQLTEFFNGVENDIVYTIGGTDSASGVADFTLNDAQLTDADEQTYGAGDENFIFGTTFTAQNSAGNAVSITNTT